MAAITSARSRRPSRLAEEQRDREQQRREEQRRGSPPRARSAAVAAVDRLACRLPRLAAGAPAPSPPGGCGGGARCARLMLPVWVPRCLRRRGFWLPGMGRSLDQTRSRRSRGREPRLDRPPVRVAADDRHVVGVAVERRRGDEADQLGRDRAGRRALAEPLRSPRRPRRAVTTTGSWTLVEICIRPGPSSIAIARTPGGPPPDSRSAAAIAAAVLEVGAARARR